MYHRFCSIFNRIVAVVIPYFETHYYTYPGFGNTPTSKTASGSVNDGTGGCGYYNRKYILRYLNESKKVSQFGDIFLPET